MSDFVWRSESDDPAPTTFSEVGDALTADAALKRVRAREYLLYTGDFQNAKQLVSAMGRRLAKSRRQIANLLEAFRSERKNRALEHETLSRIVVSLDAGYKLALKRAPDVALACRQVWGPAPGKRTLVPLKTLLGMLGAAEFRRTGLAVPGLNGLLAPHYGVYAPTRTDYADLLAGVKGLNGKTVFDIGTGTGLLGLMLLQRGAASVKATDIDERAVECASENAARLGLGARFEVMVGDLYPPGRADLVVCNPPWIPEAPKNRMDRAVFDEDSKMLQGFLTGLPKHLTPNGQGLLILSDLPELLGLRAPGWLAAQVESAGLTITSTRGKAATHGKAQDKGDALHLARSKELTSLHTLTVR